jgi:hypothetical protein
MDEQISANAVDQNQVNNIPVIVDSDEDLVRAYIGKNNEIIYPKISKKNRKFSFNIYAVLFGWPYFFYRKIYYPVLIPIVIVFLPRSLSTYGVYFMTAFNMCFYLTYKAKIEKVIKKIKNDNSNKTRQELINLSSVAGGVLPIWIVAVAIILFIILISFLYTYMSAL